MTSTGTKLRQHRYRRLLKLSDVAPAIKIKQQRLQVYEFDDAPIPSPVLKRLAKYYGVTADWLLDDQSDMPETYRNYDDAVKKLTAHARASQAFGYLCKAVVRRGRVIQWDTEDWQIIGPALLACPHGDHTGAVAAVVVGMGSGVYAFDEAVKDVQSCRIKEQ